MKIYKADLHIHTCLSPCAELDMSPRRITRRAVEMKLGMIGICDHNTCDNVSALRDAARGTPVAVVGGMEITSQEEVHVLAWFDADEDLFSVQKALHAHLADAGESRWREEQVMANADDEVLGFHAKLLMGAVQMSLAEIVDLIHTHHGLAAASHVDREGFGIIAQLGFIPPDLPLDAVELVAPRGPLRAVMTLPVLASSDAHRPEEIGRRSTLFTLQSPTVAEIREALLGRGGRKAEA